MSLLAGTMAFDNGITLNVEPYSLECWRVLVISPDDHLVKNIYLTKVELLTLISNLIASSVIDKVHPKLRCMLKGG